MNIYTYININIFLNLFITGVRLDVLIDDRIGLLGRPPARLEVVARHACVGPGLCVPGREGLEEGERGGEV